MKLRTGFVSNSSASSFCILGWKFEDKDEWVDTKFFDDIKNKIMNLDPSLKEEFVVFHDSSNNTIVGIGSAGTEIDHGLDTNEGEYWEDFYFDPPDYNMGKKLEAVAKKLGMDNPQIFRETWFDG